MRKVAGATAVRGSAPDGAARPAAPPGDDGVEADDVDGTGTTARQPVLP